MRSTAKTIGQEAGYAFAKTRVFCVALFFALVASSFCGCKSTTAMRGQDGTATPSFCSNCGNQPHGRYCEHCGLKVDWWPENNNSNTGSSPSDSGSGAQTPTLAGGGAEFGDTSAFVQDTSAAFNFAQEKPVEPDAAFSTGVGSAVPTTSNALVEDTTRGSALGKEQTLGDVAKAQAETVRNDVQNAVEQAKTQVAEAANEAAAKFDEKKDELAAKANEVASNVEAQASEAAAKVEEKAKELADQGKETLDSAVASVSEQAKDVAANVEQAKDELQAKVEEQAKEVSKAVENIAEEAKEKEQEHSANKAEEEVKPVEGEVDPDDDRYWPEGMAKNDSASPLKTASFSKKSGSVALKKTSASSTRVGTEVAKAEPKKSRSVSLPQRGKTNSRRQLTVGKADADKK